ncbi:DUF4928 family protein [Enterobacter sichuanensis]|uniref:DUF4928 family protein n=1 Tax=Enterobacter sichuanensis TaxID=2071710 RepID=UPI0028134462|nr:DUF4928 family protein [Enterobacter sichuanensis]MDR0175355.1 DUF4928 family protein [Enterobacter sichuanensis]
MLSKPNISYVSLDVKISSRRANANDPHIDREGAFQVGTTAFHVTTAPMEKLISHCL